MCKPLNATITYLSDEQRTPRCLDARLGNDRQTTRFVQNDDGTWSTWTQKGAMRRKFIRDTPFFRLTDGHLYPLTWDEIDAIREATDHA